ncbi:MAG: hypothetical protein MZV64_63515 [Ignavibacteriales bacterium]|nr:hypothetical protein [Ignavibacteriales bacterium]
MRPARSSPCPRAIQVAVPPGHVGLVWDKSGISLKGVHRLAGVIDAGYRGEVQVVMINLGAAPFAIRKGMKIAQMLVQPVTSVDRWSNRTRSTTPRAARAASARPASTTDRAPPRAPFCDKMSRNASSEDIAYERTSALTPSALLPVFWSPP